MAFTRDIFNRRPLQFGGAFAADSARIELNLGCQDLQTGQQVSSLGLLTQQLNIQYQQPVTRLYEVGTQKTYYVAGRPQGTANIARILGPGNVSAAFYNCLGDVCMADINDLCFCLQANCLGNPQAATTGVLSLCLKNVVLQSLGFAVQAQDMVINEQMSLFFTTLLATSTGVQCRYEAVQAVQCKAQCDYPGP
jgi:hypothetical protein